MQQRFLLQILLLAQRISGTTMPIIRSSRVLYSGCCLWYFVLWFSSCSSGVELRVMCPVFRMQLPETCWASNNICNKKPLLHLVGILFPHINEDARLKPHQIHIEILWAISGANYNTALLGRWYPTVWRFDTLPCYCCVINSDLCWKYTGFMNESIAVTSLRSSVTRWLTRCTKITACGAEHYLVSLLHKVCVIYRFQISCVYLKCISCVNFQSKRVLIR